jgi:hypothetical protein
MARQRYRAAQRAVRFDEWSASGLDLPEFCRRRERGRGTMRGRVYQPALKRAIEGARREGHVKEAESTHEVAPPFPSPAVPPRTRWGSNPEGPRRGPRRRTGERARVVE